MAKTAFNKKMARFTCKMYLELRSKLVKCYIWSIALYGAETWRFRAVDQKHLENFKCGAGEGWRISAKTDHARHEEVLFRAKGQRNVLHEISKRKANWIGHILCRNCLLQQVIEGKINGGLEVTGRRGKLLDDINP
jgi:hypothetical protein